MPEQKLFVPYAQITPNNCDTLGGVWVLQPNATEAGGGVLLACALARHNGQGEPRELPPGLEVQRAMEPEVAKWLMVALARLLPELNTDPVTKGGSEAIELAAQLLAALLGGRVCQQLLHDLQPATYLCSNDLARALRGQMAGL